MAEIASCHLPDVPQFSNDATAWLISLAEEACKKTVLHTQSADVNGDGKRWNKTQDRLDLQLTIYSSEAIGAGSKLLRHKGVCIFNDIAPEALSAFILNNPHRLTWDRNIANLQTIPIADQGFVRDGRTFQRRCFMLRSCTKQVGPISGRDYIDSIMVMTLEDGSILSCGAGLLPEQTFRKFPVTSALVRGYNHPSGWHFERCGTGGKDCKVSYVIHTDLKGWFTPLVINNAIGGSYVAFFQVLRAVATDHLFSFSSRRQPFFFIYRPTVPHLPTFSFLSFLPTLLPPLLPPLTHSPTHPLTHSPTHPLTHSPTHPLTHTPSHSFISAPLPNTFLPGLKDGVTWQQSVPRRGPTTCTRRKPATESFSHRPVACRCYGQSQEVGISTY